METTLEPWRHAWRVGLEPLLSLASLKALRHALTSNDPALIRGLTVRSSEGPGMDGLPRDVVGACLIGYCGWKAEGLETRAEVLEFFAGVCNTVDERLGEPNGVRWLLNAYDYDLPGEKFDPELLAEIDLALAARGEEASPDQAA